MKKYNIYGMGAAIVDTEVVVNDSFIKENDIGKGPVSYTHLTLPTNREV